MSGYLFMAFVIGYFVGRWHWKTLADDALAIAGWAILLSESLKDQLEAQQ